MPVKHSAPPPCWQPPLDLSRLDAEAVSRIGPGWTLMTALQWLTGSKAHAVIAALAGDVSENGK